MHVVPILVLFSAGVCHVTAARIGDESNPEEEDWRSPAKTRKVGDLMAKMEKIAPGSTKGLTDELANVNGRLAKKFPGFRKGQWGPRKASAGEDDPNAPELVIENLLPPDADEMVGKVPLPAAHEALPDLPAAHEVRGPAPLVTQMRSILPDNALSERNLPKAAEDIDEAGKELMAMAAAANDMIRRQSAENQKEEIEMTAEVQKDADIIGIATAAKRISEVKLKGLEAFSSALKHDLGESSKADAKKHGLLEEDDESEVAEVAELLEQIGRYASQS